MGYAEDYDLGAIQHRHKVGPKTPGWPDDVASLLRLVDARRQEIERLIALGDAMSEAIKDDDATWLACVKAGAAWDHRDDEEDDDEVGS